MVTTPQRPRFSKRILAFTSVGLLVLVIYLYFFVGTGSVVETLVHTNLPIYASAFVCYTLSVYFVSLTWHSLLRNLKVQVTQKRTLLLTWFGLFFDATVPEPGWTGDLSKAYLLSKKIRQDPGGIVATVVEQKILTMAITILDLVLGFILFASTYVWTAASTEAAIFIAVIIVISAGSLITVYYVSTRPKVTSRLLGWLERAILFVRRGKWDQESFHSGATETLNRFHQGIQTLSTGRRALIRPILLCLLSWTFDLSVVFLVFASLGYPIPVDKVLIVYALTGSLQSIGISFVGFTEIVMTGSYTALGIQLALGLSVTLLTRLITLWFKLVVSYIAFQFAGTEILMEPKSTGVAFEKKGIPQ